MANRLFYYTSGYPFLVSNLCKIIDEDILPEKEVKEWTNEDMTAAVQLLIRENNTNFETLSTNIENNKDLYRLIYQVMIDSEQIAYSSLDPLTNFGLMYGIFVVKNSAQLPLPFGSERSMSKVIPVLAGTQSLEIE